MKLTLANSHLHPAIEFLHTLKLSGATSRARTRLIHILQPHLKALQEAEYALVAEHAQPNEDGTPAIREDGTFTLQNPEHASDYAAEHDTLFNEIAHIEQGTYTGHRQACIDLLTAYDQPLSGTDADIYDALLSALEEGSD